MSPPLQHPSSPIIRRAGMAKQSQTSDSEDTAEVKGAAGGEGGRGEEGREEGKSKGTGSSPRFPIRKGCARPVEQEVLQRGSCDGKCTAYSTLCSTFRYMAHWHGHWHLHSMRPEAHTVCCFILVLSNGMDFLLSSLLRAARPRADKSQLKRSCSRTPRNRYPK